VLEEIEPEILARMRMAEQDKEFQNFRYLKKDPSNIALYDYVMLLKWWCMADAAKNLIETYQLAWVDFGFNHGGSLYIKSEDFDFCWSYDYPYKLSAFCLNDPDKMVLIDSLQFQHDCFTGCSFVIPAGLCATFWTYMKEAMCSLLDLNCIDDDQQLMLMVYKKHKELFYIQIANWFDMFRLNSNQNFTIKQKKQGEFVQNQAVQVSLMRRCWRKLKHLFKKKEEKEMQRLDPFIERMLEKKRKYYG
jgi:hypothetical protein